MYFKEIIIENVGPIDDLKIIFNTQEKPKPLLIVGENGTGKSILLSHLVNALIVGKQNFYDDTDVDKGRVYNYRSPNYVKAGTDYSYAKVNFESGDSITEWQLLLTKSEFEEKLMYTPVHNGWNNIPPNEHSLFDAKISNTQDTQSIFKKQCCLYFPVNRFEEPAWLNIDNLKSTSTYTDLKRISGISNREIVCTSPLRKNTNWILDVLLDRQINDLQVLNHQVGFPPVTYPIFGGFKGQSSKIYDAINTVIRIILNESNNVRLGVADRHNRQICVMKDESLWIPNLFQLSTGEVQLINLFTSIIRDFDLSDGVINDLVDIKGIVIIDEIDSHLHTLYQREILPKLIQSFPNVQFIITTHSPLFLIGMKNFFGEDGFDLINMPNAQYVSINDYSELDSAYESFLNTERHRQEIEKTLSDNSKPILFVEGDYDIRYINKAATLLNKNNILDKLTIMNGDGYGNLDKIWRNYSTPISNILSNKVILLFDCDTSKQDSQKNNIYKRMIKPVMGNPIEIGIENLFSHETISRVEEINPSYIDIQPSMTNRIRGQDVTTPEKRSVNKDEKGNMCNWLCTHGSREDFIHFESIFSLIDEIIAG